MVEVNRLVAHRGYRASYPENTLVSLEAALQLGAKNIEFDLQLNADHDFVLLHDDNFLRTAGLDLSIFEATSPRLREISVHLPERYTDSFSPQYAPLLQEALELLAQYPEVTAFVEIKEESLQYWGLEFVMDRLFGILARHRCAFVIISFSADAIRYARNKTSFSTGWVLKRYDQASLQMAEELAPDYLICNRTKLSEIRGLPDGNWWWMVYGVETIAQIQHDQKLGTALFETDYIGELIAALS